MKKAYQVTNLDGGDETSIIVFEETASKAKSIAHHTDGFDCEWLEMSVKRAPDFDQYAEKFEVMWWSDLEARRIYRAKGWQMLEARSCDCCGQFEDDEIPESTISETEDGELCKECQEMEKLHSATSS